MAGTGHAVAADKSLSSPPAAASPWGSIKGKVVMVTGASSGLGWGFCIDLARAGCLVVAAARRVDRLQQLCDKINAEAAAAAAPSDSQSSDSIRAVAVTLDVAAGEAEIEASIAKAWQAFGRIDALINNAGYRGETRASPIEWPESEWDKIIRTNLTGMWLVTKRVCRRMHDAKVKGSVINISSIAGLGRGYKPGGLAYTSSKGGANSMSMAMAMELGPIGIRVNAIAPGLFDSEITAGLLRKEWIHQLAERTAPLKTYGTMDPALTSVVRYLIHDSSEYVSGNVFIADCGVSLTGVPIYSSL